MTRLWMVLAIGLGVAVAGCGSDPDAEAVKALPKPTKKMYCYQQLGKVVCYARPVPRDAARIIWHPGMDQPPPDLDEEVIEEHQAEE